MENAATQAHNLFLCHTIVQAIIRDTTSVGMSDDDSSTDFGPDRTDFTLTVTAGEEETAHEWFLEVAGCGVIQYGNSRKYSEIGPCPWKIEDGALIEISFTDFLEARLNFLAAAAKQNVNMMAFKALQHIQKS